MSNVDNESICNFEVTEEKIDLLHPLMHWPRVIIEKYFY